VRNGLADHWTVDFGRPHLTEAATTESTNGSSAMAGQRANRAGFMAIRVFAVKPGYCALLTLMRECLPLTVDLT
jgi:hypothetical protein